jgi:hypothetical protein
MSRGFMKYWVRTMISDGMDKMLNEDILAGALRGEIAECKGHQMRTRVTQRACSDTWQLLRGLL